MKYGVGEVKRGVFVLPLSHNLSIVAMIGDTKRDRSKYIPSRRSEGNLQSEIQSTINLGIGSFQELGIRDGWRDTNEYMFKHVDRIQIQFYKHLNIHDQAIPSKQFAYKVCKHQRKHPVKVQRGYHGQPSWSTHCVHHSSGDHAVVALLQFFHKGF